MHRDQRLVPTLKETASSNGLNSRLKARYRFMRRSEMETAFHSQVSDRKTAAQITFKPMNSYKSQGNEFIRRTNLSHIKVQVEIRIIRKLPLAIRIPYRWPNTSNREMATINEFGMAHKKTLTNI